MREFLMVSNFDISRSELILANITDTKMSINLNAFKLQLEETKLETEKRGVGTRMRRGCNVNIN